MTMRRWLTMAFAAAMLAGVGACKNSNDGYKATPTGTGATEPGTSSDRTGNGTSASAPEGRRATPLPRARAMDAGVRETETGQTTSGVSSGSNSDNAPATGTTPGGSGTDNATSTTSGK